jgi:lipopolysaccharide/colanic/teichoic acid biosynthesis glycosyltransferase
VEKVIFTSDEIPFTQIFNIVARQQKENVSFLIAGGELDYIVGKSAVTLLEDISLMKINYNIGSGVHRFYKRVFDLAVSIPVLMLIYPFVFLLAKAKKSEFFGFVLGMPSVFIGKKSIVGPIQSDYENNLYLGKPGLTGYWFTETIDRNDKDEITKLNLFYAKNQNIWLDLDILGKTILKMFNGVE